METGTSSWIAFFAIPLLIFSARVLDVSLGTMRIALVARGARRAAPLVGFFESLVWLIAISQVVQHLGRVEHYLAWATGYATGTWCGLLLEDKLALGLLTVRVITEEDASDLLDELRDSRFGVTSFAARGLRGRVRLLLSVINRRDLDRFFEVVRRLHPRAFVSASDVRMASEGYRPGRAARWRRHEMARRK